VKLYADRPTTVLRQVLTDVFVIAWVYLWVRVSLRIYDLVSQLAAPGRRLESGGTALADNLASAGRRVDRVPAVGDALASPFGKAADAARSLAAAGRDQQTIVGEVALVLAIAILVVPLTLVVFGWLPLRLRWMRRAAAAAAIGRGEAGRDLLALRALASQPLRRLAALDPDIAAAWRRGDPAAVNALADLELRRLGLRAR
jgi:hypothetical protein